MRHELPRRLEESGYSRPGFPERYDAVRPPVDAFWTEHANEVVGVEPNAQMRRWAEERTNADNARYLEALSYETRLPNACADLVTAAQSLQWMDPEPALAEIAPDPPSGRRLLRYEYFALQTPLWEPEAAYEALRANVAELRRERNLDEGKRLWPVTRERLEASRAFRLREVAAHVKEPVPWWISYRVWVGSR